jgi:ubiquinone/menaquinone biosynthesis C-methylase UbiE
VAETNEHVANVLANLRYFTEWGARGWRKLVAHALHQFLGTDLQGQKILEVGSRYGKMSCLFALLGAEVVGVDINRKILATAREEACRWGVQERVQFVGYDGDLDVFPDEQFDAVFTKSVLVLVPQLDAFLRTMSAKLKPQGKVVFIENSYGNRVLHLLRNVWHRKWNFRKASYFTPQHVATLRNIFDVRILKKVWLPPIYLICGQKKTTG